MNEKNEKDIIDDEQVKVDNKPNDEVTEDKKQEEVTSNEGAENVDVVEEKKEETTETNEEVETPNSETTETKQVEKVSKDSSAKKAKKKKQTEEDSWFIKIFKEEHKWETYLLGFISCVAIGIGALILTDVLVFKADTPVLSDYPDVVGWVFEIFGIIGLLLFIIPIFRPTKKEIVHLTYPTKKLFLANVFRVFVFITFMALIFLLFESVISAILGKIV